MRTIKGPSLFIAQFIGAEPEFATLDGIAPGRPGSASRRCRCPTSHPDIFDVEQAAASQAYCDDFRAALDRHGLVVSELAAQRQGHLMAVHPAYDAMADAMAPDARPRRPGRPPALGRGPAPRRRRAPAAAWASTAAPPSAAGSSGPTSTPTRRRRPS